MGAQRQLAIAVQARDEAQRTSQLKTRFLGMVSHELRTPLTALSLQVERMQRNGAELGAWTQVRAAARLARLGCDAYAYAMVAAGTMDLVVEAGLKAWDIDAAIPVR